MLLIAGINAQNQFQKVIGFEDDEIRGKVLQTSTGNYIVATTTFSKGAGERDIMVMMLDPDGSILWNTILGTGDRNIIRRIIEINPNKYLFICWLTQYATTDDWHLFTMDASGNMLGEKFIGGSHDDELTGLTFADGGHYMAVGTTWSFSTSGYCDVMVAELDQDFNVSWSKIYGTTAHDFAHNVIRLSGGNFVMNGMKRSGSSAHDKIMVSMFTPEGEIAWTKIYGGSGAQNTFGLVETPDNKILILGFTNSFGAGDYDALVMKLETNGDLIWAKTYGGAGEEKVFDITTTQNSTYFISGTTSSFGNGMHDLMLFEIDQNGELLNANTYGGPEEEIFGYHTPTSDGGTLLTCETESYGAGEFDLYLVKTDDQGISCCSLPIEDMQVNAAGISVSNQSFTSGTGYDYPTYNIVFDNAVPEVLSLCQDSISLLGPDSVCKNAQNVVYTITPSIPFDIEYQLPEGASITGTGDSTIVVNFGDSSGYIIVSSNYCNYLSDSLYITISDTDPPYLGEDTVICSSQEYILSPPGSYESYLWQDGSTDSVYLVNNSGLYWVEVIDAFGCAGVDSIYIEYYPFEEVSLGNDTLICSGDSLVLNAGSGYTSYFWNTGQLDSTITVVDPGTYWVEVQDENGCQGADTILVDIYPLAYETIDLGPDTTICFGDPYPLVVGSGYTYIEWQDGSNDTIFFVEEPGTYYVYAENPCSSGSDTVIIDFFPLIQIDLGNDTSFCHGDNIYLDPGFGFLSYFWQDGSTNQGIYAGETGVYWVEVTDNNLCTAVDSIFLEFLSPEINLGNDTSICQGEQINLEAQGPFTEILWSDGSSENFISVDTSGAFWCAVTDTMGCQGVDTINILMEFPPEVKLGPDQDLCEGDSMMLYLNPELVCDSFVWSDGSSDSSCLVKEPGLFWLSASNHCGEAIDSVFVYLQPLPDIFLGNDTIIDINSQLLLDAGEGFESYTWNDGSDGSTMMISQPGIYWVSVDDGICKNSDSISIEQFSCDLFIPNVFTPNGDNYNEHFFADVSEDIYDFNLKVFNRWGEKIWETDNKYGKWDGRRNNSPAAEGTYFWVVRFSCSGYPGFTEKKGTVSLLR